MFVSEFVNGPPFINSDTNISHKEGRNLFVCFLRQVNQRDRERGREREMFVSEFVNGGIRKEETCLFAFDDKSTREREMFVSEFA